MPTLLSAGEPGDSSASGPVAESVQAWQRTLAGDSATSLPLAAHAEVDPTGTAMTTAEFARSAMRDCLAAEDALRDSLRASLRPYQIRGVAWLARTAEVTGGAVLADEMGLGKTVQAIGLLTLRAHEGPQLVVCPTSLVTNWAHEMTRFAPTLDVHTGPLDHTPEAPGSVAVISYARLRLSIEAIRRYPWATVVFDEAQALKNPRTQVSRAARSIDARARIALTGTPIENSLDDLWAILRVIAPGVFPHRAVFRRRFTRAVDDGDTGALHRLRVAVSPVVLARTKSRVASALPPKISNPVLVDLTDEQAQLYDAHLARVEDDGFGDGFERHGRILATLTRLKQICNHPGLVTGDTRVLTGRSGKLDVCTEILGDNLRTDSPTLVFTQYRDTGELLVRHLAEQFGVDVPFFHGGLPPGRRDELVADFQAGRGPGVMVMSLKAGGVGLTLTRACDVIHFDRWWNPAVEAQASDRVHRIGQQRPVTITTLTSATSLEEHIDDLHRRKSALSAHADDSSALAELTGLSDERLIDVLRRNREVR
ncbi:Superfamily II DNA/RNA helicase, SNF2 family protein [Gordonia terrae C-6]|uniref:Superfamily II DNA/RNA helicase, SNF2 family protein n=1 Tax=Gordonia terrae C-6 TaxID=1316928 RepID=R7YB65_9ACTN|nr:DEAD/DEAH box helicase [Gordonia terrae]EON33004.1 Superfamily II DNA/RNA helicase, SNF2 family protein [Gordonia terrae C-6]